MKRVIGIDLGTTNSLVSYYENGSPEVIDLNGYRKTPSVVTFEKDGTVTVGREAKNQIITKPDNTVSNIKRRMGENYEFKVGDKSYKPEQISAEILKELKNQAEDYLGEDVEKAVITVPAYFNEEQRQATKDAGEIAGLEVERLLPEPTAGAIAYSYSKDKDNDLIVYDLGGGTFDVSYIKSGGGVFEVKSTGGDNNLGGEDWTDRILSFIQEKIEDKYNFKVEKGDEQYKRLKENAEEAKKDLSSKKQANINIPFFGKDENGDVINVDESITRAKFEDLTKDLLDRTKEPLNEVIENSSISKNDIDDVILLGGSTRMPQVTEFLKNKFGFNPKKDINPDEAVVMGASIQGSVIDDNQSTDLVVLDTVPLSLGIETKGGVFDKLIEKDTTIPAETQKIYTTARDGQKSISTVVAQGERKMARENKILDEFVMTGIPSAPSGKPQIEVTFEVDENGIINLEAELINLTDKNIVKEVKIEGGTGLSEDEIKKMKKEAEEYEQKDKYKLKKTEIINEIEKELNNIDNYKKEYSDDLSNRQEKKYKNLEQELEEFLEEVKNTELENINEKEEEKEQKIKKVSKISGEIFFD